MLDLQRQYDDNLHLLGLAGGDGATITCPSCGRTSWLTMPADRSGHDDCQGNPTICCPAACGYFANVATFSPRPMKASPPQFDTYGECQRCKVKFAVDGVLFRRPCCAIENPREVMLETLQRIRERTQAIAGTHDRTELEALLNLLVSTFDGLMRGMHAIAKQNARYFSAVDPAHPVMASMLALPESASFQNLSAARTRLLGTGWDMASTVPDWSDLVRLFQKRHLVAHRLGVVDQEYIDKTGDLSAVLGKRVGITADEVVGGAEACHGVVGAFFGQFLS